MRFQSSNLMLGRLSDSDHALLAPFRQSVEFRARQRMEQAYRRVDHVYFLESGLASVMVRGIRSGGCAEIALIGREGVIGLPGLLGADSGPFDVVSHCRGLAVEIPARALRQAASQSPSLLTWLLGYAHVFAVQCAATALANARGSLEARLARWLLMVEDRLGQAPLLMTHDILAFVLGVRRAGVSEALERFRRARLIANSRGLIRIIDREGIALRAAGLYGAAEAEYARLFLGSG